jgi:hypothetical protein
MEFINAATPEIRALNQRRRGEDPRMTRAVAARLAYPDVSLHRALLMGGFKFSKKNIVIHDTMAAPYTTNRNGSMKNNKKREAGVTDCDNILLSQRKKQLSQRLRLLVAYNNRKKDKTAEQKERVHCSHGYNARREKPTLVDAATGTVLGENSAVRMCSASEHIGCFNKPRISSNNNAPNPSNHVVLQDRINELKVLKEQESSLNQEIHALILSSSSDIGNTPGCFKPARASINAYPATLLGEQPSTSLYQDVSSNLNMRVQTDLLWLNHPSISKGAPLPMYHPQQPDSTNLCCGTTMSIPLATMNYHQDPRMCRLPDTTSFNGMEQQLYRDALMLASPVEIFLNNDEILGDKSMHKK